MTISFDIPSSATTGTHECRFHIGDENGDEMYPLFCENRATVLYVMRNESGSHSWWYSCDEHDEDNYRQTIEQYPYRPLAILPLDS